ncbi:YheU family protein [Vibrio sp. RC27]
MIVPWQEIAPDTLNTLIQEFVLREGTDYGNSEIDLTTKIEQVKSLLSKNDAVIVYSELHESIDIQIHPKLR